LGSVIVIIFSARTDRIISSRELETEYAHGRSLILAGLANILLVMAAIRTYVFHSNGRNLEPIFVALLAGLLGSFSLMFAKCISGVLTVKILAGGRFLEAMRRAVHSPVVAFFGMSALCNVYFVNLGIILFPVRR
jgi:hypothetical protein